MSLESMAIVLHHSKAKGTAKLVALGIANHDGDGGAFPSMATLAVYGSCDVRNARKAVRRLEELREVRVYLQAGDVRNARTKERLADELQPNRYEILIQCPPWCDRTKNHRDTRKSYGGSTMPLWINPRTVAPGGTEAPGGSPDGSAPLTVHSEPPTPGSASSTGQARVGWRPVVTDAWVPPVAPGPPCSVCSRPAVQCQSAQVKWSAEDRHPFTPRGKS